MSGIVSAFGAAATAKAQRKVGLVALQQSVELIRASGRRTVAEINSIAEETRQFISGIRLEGEARVTQLLEGAEFSEEQSVFAIDNARIDENRFRDEAEQASAKREVAAGKTNFRREDFEDLLRASDREEALDAALIRRGGQIKALDFLQKAQNDLTEAVNTTKAVNLAISGAERTRDLRIKSTTLAGQAERTSIRFGAQNTDLRARAQATSSGFRTVSSFIEGIEDGLTLGKRISALVN